MPVLLLLPVGMTDAADDYYNDDDDNDDEDEDKQTDEEEDDSNSRNSEGISCLLKSTSAVSIFTSLSSQRLLHHLKTRLSQYPAVR